MPFPDFMSGALTFKQLYEEFPQIDPKFTPDETNDFYRDLQDRAPGIFDMHAPGWDPGMVDYHPGESETERFNRSMRQTVKRLHLIYRWAKFHMPVFNITEDFMASLVLTDPSNVKCEDIYFPFPVFCISIPVGFWHVGGNPVSSIWFQKAPAKTMSGAVEDTIMIEIFSVDGFNVSETSTNIYLNEGECLPGTKAGDLSVGPWVAGRRGRYVSEHLEEGQFGMLNMARRLIVNLAIFISERGKGKKRAAKKRYTKRDKKVGPYMPDVWEIGATIKLAPELIDFARDSGDADMDPKARARWKLKKEIVVTGHWRRQPIGPRGGGQWKWKRIEPYVKGRGPKLTHMYETALQPPPKKKKGKKSRRRRKKNPELMQLQLDDQVLQFEQEADEAADTAEMYYAEGQDDYGDYFADLSDSIFDQLEAMTGEVYE